MGYKGKTQKKVEELENDIELESSSFVICSMIPGQGLGLKFEGFVEFIKKLEMSKRTTLLNILNQLHKPLSTINDRWRKRIELLLNFTVQYAVELRGPTEDEIEFRKQKKELFKLQSKKGRPKAKKRI